MDLSFEYLTKAVLQLFFYHFENKCLNRGNNGCSLIYCSLVSPLTPFKRVVKV